MSAPRILGYREEQVFRLVGADIAERGFVRSYEAIAAALGMRHKATVCHVISRLERRGLLLREGRPGRRAIRVIDNQQLVGAAE